MLLTDAQQKVLHRYIDEIQWQLGISLGYSSIFGTFLDEEKNGFIIHEEGRLWDAGGYTDGEVTAVHLIHPLDYEIDWAGIMVATEVKEFPLRDDQCETFLKRIMRSLEDGSLTSNPSLVREISGARVEVTQMGGISTLFSIQVDTEDRGHGATDDIVEKPDWLRSTFYTEGQEVMKAINEMVKELTAK